MSRGSSAVREAIGPDVGLMIDANHAWTPYQAIRFARAVERYDIGWLEEPVYPWDHQGCAEVARALDVPVATGENVSSRFGFRDMIDARACDIVQADALYCGGLTEWRKIAAYAAAHNLPMAPARQRSHRRALRRRRPERPDCRSRHVRRPPTARARHARAAGGRGRLSSSSPTRPASASRSIATPSRGTSKTARSSANPGRVRRVRAC